MANSKLGRVSFNDVWNEEGNENTQVLVTREGTPYYVLKRGRTLFCKIRFLKLLKLSSYSRLACPIDRFYEEDFNNLKMKRID